MIPKIIHYCWFGPSEMPMEQKEYIKYWKELHPDWKFKLWTEKNSPMKKQYLKNAFSERKWSNMSNYVRLFAVYNNGGIYIDTDYQLLKPLDRFLRHKCFIGFESDGKGGTGLWVNNAFFGAEAGNEFVGALLQRIEERFDGTEEANLSSPRMTTELLRERGLKDYKNQTISGVKIYKKEYFSPIEYNERFDGDGSEKITSNTYAVHKWADSWKDVQVLKKTLYNIKKALANRDKVIEQLQMKADESEKRTQDKIKHIETQNVSLIRVLEELGKQSGTVSTIIDQLEKRLDIKQKETMTAMRQKSVEIQKDFQKRHEVLAELNIDNGFLNIEGLFRLIADLHLDLQRSNEGLENELRIKERDISSCQKQIVSLQDAIKTIKDNYARSNTYIENAQNELNQEFGKIKERIGSKYKNYFD